MSCQVEACDGDEHARGYCLKHYLRVRRHGDPSIVLGFSLQRRAMLSAAMSARLTGKKLSLKQRRKQGRTMRKTLSSPEVRERWRQSHAHVRPTEETRQKISLTKSKKPKKLSHLIHKSDIVFSQYIRKLHSDGRGNCRCFTCDVVKPIAETDCGHFVGRQHKSLRWSERNAHPQCRYCNRYNEGRKDVYAVRLMEKYGPNILLELQEEKNQIKHWTPADLEELIAQYKVKLAALN